MQRGFGGNFYPKNTKTNYWKTLEKSINSGQNKNFFKILKKSVAKIVRFFDVCSKKIALMRGSAQMVERLMGNKPELRFQFIREHAKFIENSDI